MQLPLSLHFISPGTEQILNAMQRNLSTLIFSKTVEYNMLLMYLIT